MFCRVLPISVRIISLDNFEFQSIETSHLHLFRTPQLSTMASTFKKQDMPPSGGYKAILFARNPARTYFTGELWGTAHRHTLSYEIALVFVCE